MEGLLVLGGGAIWLALSAWLARHATRYATKLTGRPRIRNAVFLVLWALCFLAPVADELIGKFQYDRYCKESEGMEIYGTIPVGEGLYTEDGKWKLSNGSLPISESNRLQVILDSIVRWEVGKNEEAPAVIPIFYHETKVYEVMTGRLLSVHRIYGTHGGWLSRSFFERGGLFVRPQCLPPLVRESKVNQTILPFNGNVGGVK